MNFNKDGVDYINVYSEGLTKLGRDLSNFTLSPFRHPLHGVFNSVEGYWYWLTRADDRLRSVYGVEAKKLGRSLAKVREYTDEDFKSLVKMALTAKLEQNPEIMKGLAASELPFVHYYVMGPERKVIVPENNEWLMDHFAEIRSIANPGKQYAILRLDEPPKRQEPKTTTDSQMSFF